MRKISIAGYGFVPRLGPEKSILAVRDAGFEAMDYPLYREDSSRIFDLGDGRIDESRCREIRRYADEVGLKIGQTHAPFGYREDDGTSFDEILDLYRRAADATAILGSNMMVVHPVKFENCRGGYRLEECFDLNLKLFDKFSAHLKGCGVIGLLENMFIKEMQDGFKRLVPTIYSSGAQLARAKDALGDAYGVCLDTGHMLITKEDIPATVKLLGKRILALHLHDNTGDRDDHLPPYFGKLPFGDLLNALKEIGYDGNLNFEVRFASVPTEELSAAFAYVRNVGVSFRRFLDGE